MLLRTFILSHVFMLVCFITEVADAKALESDELKKERSLFVDVETAVKAGNRKPFKRHQAALKNYALYPYMVYLDLRNRLSYISDRKIVEFLENYGGHVPVAEKLRHQWLEKLARHSQWSRFLRHYREPILVISKNNKCNYARALIHTGKVQQAQELMKSLWLVGFSQPTQCDFVFKWGFDQRLIGDDLVWERALLVWKHGREGLMNYLGSKLKGDARRWFKHLKQARSHPEREALKMSRQFGSSSYTSDVMQFALHRLIRKDVVKSGEVWGKIKRICRACRSLKSIEKEIGVAAAKSLMPVEASHRLSNLLADDHDKESRYWRIRIALRVQKWDQVLASIDALQEDERALPQWNYWRAHALAALGDHNKAHLIWEKLSQKDNYYGYLSADKLRKAYPYEMQSIEFSANDMTAFEAYPAVGRIRELLIFGRLIDASRELSFLLERLSTRGKLKLAFMAHQWQWPIGAIRSISSSGVNQHLVELFPMLYQSIVEAESRRSKVPAERIYAIMRRESAFVKDIKSPAGALGLMQLLPNTAQDIAMRLGIGKVSTYKILSPQNNVRLGTAYIKRLSHKNNGNFAASLAGYNAGPVNARRWLKNAPVTDDAIWIDTIPFDETRLYVRAVLFYTIAYRHLLGKSPIRLRELMTRS